MIRPLGARVLIKREPLPEMTASGIYLLGREFPSTGTVLAIGAGRKSKTGDHLPITDIEVGDRVTFRWPDAYLDTREVGPDTFILDYDICTAGMRTVEGKLHIWPLGGWLFVREAAPTDSP